MTTLDDRDDAAASDAGFDQIAAERFQLFFDKACRFVNVIEQFRVLMQMATPCGDLACSFDDTIKHWHFGNILRFSISRSSEDMTFQ